MAEENERITRRDMCYGAALWDANNQIVALVPSKEHVLK